MQDFTKYTPNQGPGGDLGPGGYAPRPGVASRELADEAVFFQKVYMWMCGGLGVTALLSYVLSSSQAWWTFISQHQYILWGALIGELVLVFALSGAINRISAGTARFMFLAYAALNGVVFSLIAYVYPPEVMFKAFLSTAGVYGAMAVYGLVTKRSLQAWGSFLFMGLIGLIIASIVNIFTKSPAMDFVICAVGVLVFAGLTAFDHQRLRVIHAGGFESGEQESKVVVMGALTLYLDFINLFLYLLRLFGNRNN